MSKRRVVVTGLGAVAPNGVGQDAFWAGIKNGKNCAGRITLFDPTDHPSQVSAEVKDFEPTNYMSAQEVRRVHRSTPFAIAATAEALKESKLRLEDLSELGVILGSGAAGLGYGEQQIRYFYKDGVKKMSPYATTGTFVGMISSDISIKFGLKGLSTVISTGCTSANDAMGCAFNYIRSGMTDILISGGAEACITPAIVAAFGKMGALSTKRNHEPKKASRPFNKDRDGFVMGEGAWIMVFEELEHAIKRNAPILAEVAGYGATCDAFHKTAPGTEGKELTRAMEIALSDAQVEKDAIDYINLHGTSTVLNDAAETVAIKRCFGDRAYKIPATSLKSMLGHPQGASGGANVVATILSINNGFAPPTINYENPDPDCDLDYVPNQGRELNIDVAMCNSIGFGSKNSILILKKFRQQ